MIILKAIGSFFVKIWRWIKDTAWVQPLLIVGAIFAVIFSIPYITEWANNFAHNSTNSFYTASKKNLEGETNGKDSKSAADLLTNDIFSKTMSFYDAQNKGTTGQFSFGDTSAFGEKYFLIYVDSTNTTSTSVESGFKFLSDNWGDYGYVPSDNATAMKYYTIFKDDKSANDDDYEDKGSAFERYLSIHTELFQNTLEPLLKCPYYTRAGLTEDNYNKYAFNGSDYASFPTPTIALIDYSASAIKAGRAGLSEVLFSVTGDTDTTKAKLLLNMWNHTDSYATDTTNLFTARV